MTLEEHNRLGLRNLQLHHIKALRDGGHPTDKENLITLCKFCHDGWHKYAEVFGVSWESWWKEEPVHLKYWEASKCGKN
jgi:5-methylcytosine-specific restriction endonuclease McrA